MMNPEPNSASTTLGQPPQTSSTEELPWWLKYAARFIGTVGALTALILGAWECMTISPRCLFAGILQMLIGVVVALIEAPCFCMFLDFAQAPSNYFDRKPHWHRSLLYHIISILPILICAGITTIFGSGLIFLTGTVYGIMALGKKASFEEMRVKATSNYNLLPSPSRTDVEAARSVPTNTEAKQPSGTI